MAFDVRSRFIDILKEFADENNLKFVWSTEARPSGNTVVSFYNGEGRGKLCYTKMISYRELMASSGSAVMVAHQITKEVKERL